MNFLVYCALLQLLNFTIFVNYHWIIHFSFQVRLIWNSNLIIFTYRSLLMELIWVFDANFSSMRIDYQFYKFFSLLHSWRKEESAFIVVLETFKLLSRTFNSVMIVFTVYKCSLIPISVDQLTHRFFPKYCFSSLPCDTKHSVLLSSNLSYYIVILNYFMDYIIIRYFLFFIGKSFSYLGILLSLIEENQFL